MLVYLFWTALTIYFLYVVIGVLPKENWAWLTVPAALVYGTSVWALYNVAGSHEVAFLVMLGMVAIFGAWAFVGEFRAVPESSE